MLHHLATGINGVLVVSAFYANPDGEADTPGAVTHHHVGDVDGMIASIEALASVDNCNVYAGLQVMRRGLGRGKRGTETDISLVLGLVADMDSDTGKAGTVPFPPSYVVETSPGNEQPVWLFDRPLSPAEAKPLAAALRRATGSDAGTADITHVWRVPGTRNWPNAKKLARGRPAEPAGVHNVQSWQGDLVDVDEFRAALSPWWSAPANDNPVSLGDLPDLEGIIVSKAAETLLVADDVGDRSTHAAKLIEQLAFDGHSAEEAVALFLAAPGNWTERYKDSEAQRKDAERLWGKFSGKHAHPGEQYSPAKLMASVPSAVNDNALTAQPHGLDIFAWPASRYVGNPPPVSYLVQDAIEAGIPCMVAAMGELGKSYALLELCRRVAFGSTALSSPIFGGQVVQEGTAVFLTGEDNLSSIHRRIAAIDSKQQRLTEKGDKLLAIPLPSAASVFSPFWVEQKGEYRVTDAWKRFVAQLEQIRDLRTVVIDPLQMFAALPINEDPAAGQFVCSQIAAVAAGTGANLFFAHHMKKPGRDGRIATLSDARDSIRGTSALVDGVRLAYGLWYPDEATGKDQAFKIGVEYQPNKIVHGGVVKANGAARRILSTYSRSESGLLIDKTALLTGDANNNSDLLDVLVIAIQAAAEAGHPYTKTGQTGLFANREKLPYDLSGLAKHRLESLATQALEKGKILSCAARGEKAAKWLDVPGGMFAIGLGTFSAGAFTAA